MLSNSPLKKTSNPSTSSRYVGLLLLDDKARRIHKENFEKYIHESSATDPQLLSTRAMLAIQNSADRLAADGSALVVHHLVLKQKRATQEEAEQ
jgi:hypothetical protein